MRNPSPGPLEPLGDRLVIRKDKPADKTASGKLYLADTAQETPDRGLVLAVGAGRFEAGERIPMTVQVGDVVLVPAHGGILKKVGGEEVLLMRESEVLGILHEGAAWP